jgi:hypothetical protein
LILGNVFPETIPFDENEVASFGYFWRKYYITKKNYYLIAKVIKILFLESYLCQF